MDNVDRMKFHEILDFSSINQLRTKLDFCQPYSSNAFRILKLVQTGSKLDIVFIEALKSLK